MLILPLFAAFFPQKPGGGALFLTGQTRQTAQQSRENLREIEGGGIQISPAYKRRNRRRTARKTTQNQTGDKPPPRGAGGREEPSTGEERLLYTRGIFQNFFSPENEPERERLLLPGEAGSIRLVMEGGGLPARAHLLTTFTGGARAASGGEPGSESAIIHLRREKGSRRHESGLVSASSLEGEEIPGRELKRLYEASRSSKMDTRTEYRTEERRLIKFHDGFNLHQIGL